MISILRVCNHQNQVGDAINSPVLPTTGTFLFNPRFKQFFLLLISYSFLKLENFNVQTDNQRVNFRNASIIGHMIHVHDSLSTERCSP